MSIMVLAYENEAVLDGEATMQLTFRTPRMVIHGISSRHFSRAQQTRPVVWYRRMRGDTPNTCALGEWYGSRAPAYRSVPSPTSAPCESLCRQDRRGRGRQAGGADRDGCRSRDDCAGHDPRYPQWPESPVPLGRVLYAPRYGAPVGQGGRA